MEAPPDENIPQPQPQEPSPAGEVPPG